MDNNFKTNVKVAVNRIKLYIYIYSVSGFSFRKNINFTNKKILSVILLDYTFLFI